MAHWRHFQQLQHKAIKLRRWAYPMQLKFAVTNPEANVIHYADETLP